MDNQILIPMKQPHVYLHTYNIAVSDGTTMKEYHGFRCTLDEEKDKEALIDRVRTFVMSYFGAWFDPVIITRKNIDLFELYLKFKDSPTRRFPITDSTILKC